MARITPQVIIVCTALQQIPVSTAVEVIAAGFAKQAVLTAIPIQLIIAGRTQKNIRKTIAAKKIVRTGSAMHRPALQHLPPAQLRAVTETEPVNALGNQARVVPVHQLHLVARCADPDYQVIAAGFLQAKIRQSDARAKGQRIDTLRIVGLDHILAITQVEHEHIVSGASFQGIVADAAGQGIVTRITLQVIVIFAALQQIPVSTAVEVIPADATAQAVLTAMAMQLVIAGKAK